MQCCLNAGMDDILREHSFQPNADTLRNLRDALGRFATGVTVITTQTANGPAGFTANSFASVSLDPALVLWSAAKTSARFPIFSQAKSYSIHILAEDQMPLASRFSRGGAGFDGLAQHQSVDGNPVIPAVLARFDCQLHATHDGGDHLIIVGRVVQFVLRNASPLVFNQGGFGRFTPDSAA